MKRFLFLTMAVLFILSACKKEQTTPTPQKDGEITFAIQQTDFPSSRDNGDVPLCTELSMDYVTFTLDGQDYTTTILYANGKLLTQPIKVTPGSYQLTAFYVYHDNLPAGPGPEDILVRAAPQPDSEYWDLMENPLDIEVTVDAFEKYEYIVDVLCYEDLFYQEFGFYWFELNDVKIERQCFFGDICTGKLEDFVGSLYEQQQEGLQMDMPAIFYIDVYKGEDLIRTFSNEDWLGEGQCLEVYWANDLDLEETFTFDLYVLLPEGEGMAYQFIHQWVFLDDACPDPGEDGVVDFTVGACQIPDADFTFPAWLDLPDYPFDMYLNYGYGPSAHGTYVDVTLTGVGAGYDIHDGQQGAWCADENTSIYLGHTYSVTAVSSLEPPAGFVRLAMEQLNRLNYFFNELPVLTGDGGVYDDPSPYWSNIQNVIWHVTNGNVLSGQDAVWAADVDANGPGFVPLPGQYASIIFDAGENTQILFVTVDP